MRVPIRIILCAAAAFVLASAGFYVFSVAVSRMGSDTQGAARMIAAPEFTLPDTEGREVLLEDFRGRPLLVYVWASWCPLCDVGLEEIALLKKEFGDAISVVAIMRAETREGALRAASPLDQATGTRILLDSADAYYRAIGGFAMPEMLLIDRNGMIVFRTRGLHSDEELRRRIEDIVQ